ncbi:hypothetical protein ACWCXH_33970 [Kitasatospora sp. NPDC001660]
MNRAVQRYVSRTAALAAGLAAAAVLVAPQAQAVPVPAASPGQAPVATELPAGAIPGNWTIDRQAPLPAAPQALAAAGVAPSGESPSVTTDFNPYLQARNSVFRGQTCGTNRVDVVTGSGPMTLTLSQSRAVASQWSASVGVSPGSVSATVGFSVTDTATNTETGSYTVPDGKFGHLEAYPLFDHFTFDVYDGRFNNAYVGGGDAFHPVGFCYNHWTD